MKKTQFQGEVISRTKVKRNILSVYHQALTSEKNDWYSEAHQYAAKMVATKFPKISELEARRELQIAIGILASLSPRKSWRDNKEVAARYYLTEDPKQCKHTKLFTEKAVAILQSNSESEILEILNGNKICSFYLNIRYPSKIGGVTIDRHALDIAVGRVVGEDRRLTSNQYEFFEQCYLWTAAELDITPQLLQSTTWQCWKRLKKTKK